MVEEEMTPEEGYKLSKYARPGVKIVMGPTEAQEEQITPLGYHEQKSLAGPSSFLAWSLGFEPSLWSQAFALCAGKVGYEVSQEEWEWLHGPATLKDAQGWLNEKVEAFLQQT